MCGVIDVWYILQEASFAVHKAFDTFHLCENLCNENHKNLVLNLSTNLHLIIIMTMFSN